MQFFDAHVAVSHLIFDGDFVLFLFFACGMKNYYEILGLRRNASIGEIRQAFRRLVREYHPDRNPDPAALEVIQAINEAYDVLGDPKRKAEYDYSLENPFTTYMPPEPNHRDPAYRRPYRAPSPPKPDPQKEIMIKGLPLARRTGWAAVLVCLFILADFLLPAAELNETIMIFRVYKTQRSQQLFLRTNTGREVQVDYEETLILRPGDLIVVTYSPILDVVRTIESEDGSLKVRNLATMYTNFSFVPILLFVMAVATLLSFRLNAELELKFNLGLVTFIVLIFTVVMMLS